MPDGAQRSQYVHGTGEEEQRRLTRLNTLMNEESLRELAPRPGERILDAGAGLGQFSRAMARLTGTPVVGVERSEEQIREAYAQARTDDEAHLLDLRQGDVFSLPLAAEEWGAFDVAHARFLLEHVPDPLAAVRGMVAAVRPGGRVVLEDDDHGVLRMWPEPPGLETVWQAYMRGYDRLGNDPIVGRRLVQLLAEAGARPRRNTWIFFGACAGQPYFEDYVATIASIIRGATDLILATGVTREQLDDALEALARWAERPDAAMWFATSWAEGVRQAG